ncbi:outer membrane protein assembly factor BamB family protein [Streptomyces sp. NBC_01334]|uniref:outer membrane protein assembly factor BamB family protein n=1 Tax=Streptomyces sp. NBC_01334 TaxID=2903827 RepID=UPI002E0D7B0C|nr:PQQ-binding-like beta-propeller repeat protein [Streptomyces sp. NBC_01334]
MPDGQQPKPRVGRREGPLAGVSPQGDALAAWLRQITAGRTLDQLVAEFNTYQRATWGEFRNGRKPIPLPLLRKVVTCLITEPSRQAGELERGRELFRAAASAAAAKDRAVASGGAGLSVRELQIRLDDARRGHIEVQQALLDNQSTVRVLEATITSLEERCAQLEAERDKALGQARSVAAVQRDLEAFTRTLAQAEVRLELAFHDRASAEVLLADVRRQAQSYRRALHALNQNAPSGADQHDTARDDASGGDPRTTAVHQQPQQWEYEALLETVDNRRTARHKQLAGVRRRLGIQAPEAPDDESATVIEGAVWVVQAPGLDNPDNAPTSHQSKLESPGDDAPAHGRAVAESATATAAPPSPVAASPTRRLTGRRARPTPGRPASAPETLPGSGDGASTDGVERGRMPWTQRSVRALRDRRLHAAATVLLLALTATTAAPPPRTPPASQERHAARHPVTAAEHVPPVRWTASFPYGIDLDAVTSDTFFLQDSDTIQAVDIATGTTRWREPSPVVDIAGPMAADDHAVYPTQDAVVQARDSSTGSFKWERNLSNLRPTSADPDLFGVVSATLSRTSDVLYVVIWAGSTERVTAALSTRTGTVLWHTGSEFLTEIGATCLMSSDIETQGVDCLSGISQWKADQTAETAVSTGTAIMAACDTEGRIRSFNAVTGRQLWQTAGPYPNPLTSLQAANGLIYFTDYNGRLYALDAATGTPRWSAPTDLTRKTPAIDRDHVYATGLDKHLYAFDATTGARVWAAPTGDYITADPQVVGNTVYAGGRDGRLHAINRTNGTHRWTTPASEAAITYLHATPEHVTTLTDTNSRAQANPIAQQR